MSRRRPQHYKGKKRRKSWHRGKTEARRSEQALDSLPDTGVGADPTTGEPRPLRESGSRQNRGDAI